MKFIQVSIFDKACWVRLDQIERIEERVDKTIIFLISGGRVESTDGINSITGRLISALHGQEDTP